MLEKALTEQSLTLSKSGGGCDGGGKGALIQNDKSATLSTLQDQTLFQPVAHCIQGSMIGRADKNGPQGDGVNEDVSFALNTTYRHAVAYGIGSYHSNAWKSSNPNSGVYVADTAKTLDALNCGYPACNQGGMAIVEPVGFDAYQHHGWRQNDKCGTLTAGQNEGIRGDTPLVVDSTVSYGVDCRNSTEYQELNATLQSDAAHNLNSNNVVRVNHIVRRLTPLECERLQGFPDGWTDIGEWVDSKGKKHKDADSPRYKALGNSIAIPPWKWVCKRLCACYERDATMASLFDGIGGFPFIWEQLNGKGSCLWASEIEEFPIAVTNLRFGGEEGGGN